MTGYARSLPHLGFDPAPGDVGLTQHLARRHYQVAQEARQVLAMVERLDLRALQGRAADAMRALQATFPPALRNTAGAADTLHAATSSWAHQLSGFQAEADALERQAAQASAHQQALQAKQAGLPPGSAVLTADLESASAAVSGIHRQAQDLHQRYLAAAAKSAADVGDHSGLWDRTEPVRTVLEAVLAPLDIVAADHWVSALGVGGVGINAVQGARVAGARRIIAVDPVEFKREQALRFGATHVYPSLDDAIAGVGALTWGQMCNSVICTFGVMRGDLLEPALTLTAKGGTCVITSVAPIAQAQADVNLFMLAMMNKEIKGCLYGSESPRTQIPRLLDLYRDGILKLDELITETYSLDQVNQGYADIAAGRVLRGVIAF